MSDSSTPTQFGSFAAATMSMAAAAATPAPVQTGWRVLYTRSRCEQKVCEWLRQRTRTAVAPVYPTTTGGSRPLFPGYVFVAANSRGDRELEMTPHVVHMIATQGVAALIDDEEIQPFLVADRRRAPLWPNLYLPLGARVRIRSGPLSGIEGILERRHSRSLVVLNIELLRCAAAVRVELADVERV